MICCLAANCDGSADLSSRSRELGEGGLVRRSSASADANVPRQVTHSYEGRDGSTTGVEWGTSDGGGRLKRRASRDGGRLRESERDTENSADGTWQEPQPCAPYIISTQSEAVSRTCPPRHKTKGHRYPQHIPAPSALALATSSNPALTRFVAAVG